MYPLKISTYTMNIKLTKEPTFKWWVPHTIQQKRLLIHKVKVKAKKYWRRTHKYGMKLPHSVEEAYCLDKQNRNELWAQAIKKEMVNVWVAFEFNDLDSIPVAHKEIRCHMVFDVKITLD